jgi:phenylpropionate dioxygenase-like ring-hydroxylating dioxygenase large terminal subunit
LEKSDEMDDEVVNIIKKWNSKDPSCQRKNIYESNNDDGHYTTFSTKTFTRPKKSTANIQNSDNNEYVESKVF